MSTVISNASPLIGLSKINLVGILKDLWESIIIPQAVHREIVIEGIGKTGVDILAHACSEWIHVAAVSNKQEVKALQAMLDEGESEVIVLGQELNADLLLIDNREPRLFAKTVNLRVMGTVGIIEYAWRKKLIKDPLEQIQNLRLNGFWIDDKLMARIRSNIESSQSRNQ